MQLTITEGGFDEQQFLSAVASGSPPDLVYLDREIIGTYAAAEPSSRSTTASSAAFYRVRVLIINGKAVRQAGLSRATSTPATGAS